MRRVPVPNTPLSPKSQISDRRLSQVVAVVTLASLKFPETTTIAVHEPNLLRLVSGANTIYTEAGANPRDENKNTEDGHGLDVEGCQKMLVDTGFSRILMGDGKSKLLSL